MNRQFISRISTIAVFAVFLLNNVVAQQSRKDFKINPIVCCDNYLAYPEPNVDVALTAAPEGYEPCYISHYGRHGSRWLIGRKAYDKAWEVLSEAADSSRLTALGQRLMMQLDTLRQRAHGRDGELTPLGARQHRGIARRMYEHFPMLFSAKGKVEARSSTVIRCILSMANELAELQGLSPQLSIDMDAASVDMAFINNPEKIKDSNDNHRSGNGAGEFRSRHFSPDRFLNTIFSDEGYWRRHIEHPSRFVVDDVWKLVADMQSLEPACGIDLSGYFTDEEMYNIWLVRNAEWYNSHGPSQQGVSKQMLKQHNLLRNIVEKADSCLALIAQGSSEAVTANLRFGHEVVVMPTVCALNLNGFGTKYEDLEQLEQQGWYSYRIFPMASNIQMVFYNHAGKDTLVKVLLNEREATMPQLTAVYGDVYYKWSDVRSYIRTLIDSYEKQIEHE